MKRAIIALGLIASLVAVPTAVASKKPTKQDRRNAARECRTERSMMGAQNFREAWGTNRNRRNAFGKCVSRHAREEHAQRHAARRNAAQQCFAECRELGVQEFNKKYGTNRNGKNAFGRCVSGKARANKREADAQDRAESQARANAARQCRAERKEIGTTAFREKYGTNRNKRNAFGKCVSQKARA